MPVGVVSGLFPSRCPTVKIMCPGDLKLLNPLVFRSLSHPLVTDFIRLKFLHLAYFRDF